MIPFKLIPRPAGLHPVTLSCSSGPCAVPHPGNTSEEICFIFPPIFSPRGKVFSSQGISQLLHGRPPPPHSLIFHTVTTIQLL